MKPFEEKTYYELLGVSHDATADEIKDAYKAIARAYHPDSNFYREIVNDTVSGDGVEVFKRITAAYNTLLDGEKRRLYDESFPKGLRDWDDGSRRGAYTGDDTRTIEEDDLLKARPPAPDASGNIYRPRKLSGAFQKSTFGNIDTSPAEERPTVDRTINRDFGTAPEQNNLIVIFFFVLLFIGFLCGAGLAYYMVTQH